MQLSRWVCLQLYGFQNQLLFIWEARDFPLNSSLSKPLSLASLQDFYGPLPMVRALVSLLPVHVPTTAEYMDLLQNGFTDFATLCSQCKGQMKSLLSLYKPPLTFNPTVSFSAASFIPSSVRIRVVERKMAGWDYWKTSIGPRHKWTLN